MTGRIKIIHQNIEVVDGRNKTTDEEYYSCWCEVSELLSSEKYEALNQKLEETAVFKVRRCSKIDAIRQHQKEYYAEYKDDRYKIYSIVPVENESKYLLKVNRIS